MATNTPNILVEGEKYDFKVLKIITLYDGKKYYVIEALNLNKYLLNCDLYKNYNICKNTTIKCKVDKINCSGRTFLEPEHPYLKEGKEYSFEIKSVEELLNDDGENEQSLIVADENNKQYIAVLDDYVNPKKLLKNIKVKIKKMSKARLFIDIIS